MAIIIIMVAPARRIPIGSIIHHGEVGVVRMTECMAMAERAILPAVLLVLLVETTTIV